MKSGSGSPVWVLSHHPAGAGSSAPARNCSRSSSSTRCCVPIRVERSLPSRIQRRTVSGFFLTFRAASGTVSIVVAYHYSLAGQHGMRPLNLDRTNWRAGASQAALSLGVNRHLGASRTGRSGPRQAHRAARQRQPEKRRSCGAMGPSSVAGSSPSRRAQSMNGTMSTIASRSSGLGSAHSTTSQRNASVRSSGER